MLLATGCLGLSPGGGLPGTNGPLEPEQSQTKVCHVTHGAHGVILGYEALVNTSSEPVTIDSIGFVGAVNLSRGRSYIASVPSRGPSTLLGLVNEPPPAFYDGGQRELWSSRAAAVGGVVPPTASGTNVNLLVEATYPDPRMEASLDHLVVLYHTNSGLEFQWVGHTAFEFATPKACRFHEQLRELRHPVSGRPG